MDVPPFSFFLMCFFPASALGRTHSTAPPTWAHRSPEIGLFRGSQRQTGLRLCISNRLPEDACAGAHGLPGCDQMQRVTSSLPPKEKELSCSACRISGASGFLFGGPERGSCQSRAGISGRGAGAWHWGTGPSASVRLSHGLLPPAKLPVLFNLSDSLKCVSREGVVLQKPWVPAACFVGRSCHLS